MIILVPFALVVLAYLVGSLPIGVLVGKAFGFNPQKAGSGNVGTTNVARLGGALPGALTFLGDLLKGLVPVVLARHFVDDDFTVLAAGFFAFLGSIASMFLGFAGGKGVATGFGVWLGLAPEAALIALVAFLAGTVYSRIVSVGSLCAAVALPIAIGVLAYPTDYLKLSLLISGIVIYRHRSNITRLLAGAEPRIGNKKVQDARDGRS